MPNVQKEVYCSAGISHILLYPNGDVYRCMADYNAKRMPLFNAKQGWKKLGEVLLCDHDKCYAGCDVDWATKWIYEANKDPKVIEAKTAHRIWAKQTIDNPLRDKIHIVWAPTLLCNYTCTYCGCAVGKYDIYKDFPSASPELSVKEWIQIWQEICSCYKFGVLTMAGGEPLLSKATLPMIKMISDRFAVGLTTNLSVNVMEIVRSGIKPPLAKLGETGLQMITGSLHPTAGGFSDEIFFGSLLYLKNNGFNVGVNFVGHPLQLFLAEEYKARCEAYGIEFVVSPWCGYDNDGFVAQYTEAEERYLNKIAPNNRQTSTQVEFYTFKCDIETNVKELEIEPAPSISLKGIIKNTGTMPWINDNLPENLAYKLGSRIVGFYDSRNVLKESRAVLGSQRIATGETCEFKIDIDIDGLAKGIYIIKLDVVKEHCFWFEDKGVQPLKIRLKIK